MSRRAWSLFAVVSVLWGVPYLLIKIADDGGMPPLLMAWGRMALGSAILLALAARSGTLRQLRGRWRAVLAYAVVELAIPLPLIAYGEQRISSSLAAIIIATVPLLVALLSLRFDPGDRFTGARLAGLLVGLAGVVLLVGLDAASSGRTLLAAGAVFIGACGYSGGPLILRWGLSGLDPQATMGASVAVAALLLTVPALLDLPGRAPSGGAIAALVGLAVLCTAAAFVAMAMLIGEVGPSRAVVVTYVNPVVALALGVLLLGERPAPAALGGLVLILAGSWLSTDGRLPWSRRRSRRDRIAA